MKKQLLYLGIVSILLLCKTAVVFAACDFAISASNVSLTWTLDYTTLAVNFSVSKDQVPECKYGVGFTKGGAASYATRRAQVGAATLRYQLYKENGLTNILQDTPFADGSNLIMGTLPEGANQEVTLTYYLAIPYSLATAPTLAKSGAYVDTFDIKVYEGDDPLTMETPVVSTSVTLTITVDPMIDLSLVSSGGSFDISKTTKTVDMGNLYQGLSRTFDMRVRTNAGYSVTFSSDNNGNLKAAGVASLIPYSFYVNAVLLNMSNSKAVPVVGLSGAGSTDLQGLSYPIRMVIGNMGATTFYGGNHQDTVTITATTTE